MGTRRDTGSGRMMKSASAPLHHPGRTRSAFAGEVRSGPAERLERPHDPAVPKLAGCTAPPMAGLGRRTRTGTDEGGLPMRIRQARPRCSRRPTTPPNLTVIGGETTSATRAPVLRGSSVLRQAWVEPRTLTSLSAPDEHQPGGRLTTPGAGVLADLGPDQRDAPITKPCHCRIPQNQTELPHLWNELAVDAVIA